MNLSLILKYLNYRFISFTEHDLHSPFLYTFYNELIKNDYPFQDFFELDKIRKQLLSNNTLLEIEDYGAGSKTLLSSTRLIKDIAKHGIAQKKQAEFLYRFINYFKPDTIIELGTSLGLTTLYLAKPCHHTKVYTIEGSKSLVDFSAQLFKAHKAVNIQSIAGNFDQELPALLDTLNKADCLYIDGNHSYEATIRYFKLALKKKHTQSIFIFDDIYWSQGMEKAWKEIYQHPEVTLSLDLFQMGIVFFRTENKNKEHFVLKF